MKPLAYTGLYLGGLDYAIINPIFFPYRLKKFHSLGNNGLTLTIALGSCLDHSIVHRLIAGLDQGIAKINLIGNYPKITPNSDHHASIEQYQSLSPNQIAKVYLESDLAIGAGGVMTLEMIYFGLPLIVVSVASNQVSQCHYLKKQRLIKYLGHKHNWSETKLQKMLHSIIEKIPCFEHRQRCQVAVDGCGAQRIVSKLYP